MSEVNRVSLSSQQWIKLVQMNSVPAETIIDQVQLPLALRGYIMGSPSAMAMLRAEASQSLATEEGWLLDSPVVLRLLAEPSLKRSIALMCAAVIGTAKGSASAVPLETLRAFIPSLVAEKAVKLRDSGLVPSLAFPESLVSGTAGRLRQTLWKQGVYILTLACSPSRPWQWQRLRVEVSDVLQDDSVLTKEPQARSAAMVILNHAANLAEVER